MRRNPCLLLEYIKKRIIAIALLVVNFLIFALVLFLYKTNYEPVLYALLYSVTFAMVAFSIDFYKFAKKANKLREIRDNKLDYSANLPHYDDIIEQYYCEIISLLDKENKSIIDNSIQEAREIKDYYAMWAHQIKTPIAGMKLLLQDKKLDNSELAIELFYIEQYVNMVMAYIRTNEINNDLSFQKIDLDIIIKDVIKKYSMNFILSDLSLDYKETHYELVTDKKWLIFVIEQLLSNSLKYTKAGQISIYMVENSLIIKDTGIGILPEDLPRIMENGFTGLNGRIDSKASGIGLYLSKTITTKLNIELSIRSQIGKGTQVALDFSNLTKL